MNVDVHFLGRHGYKNDAQWVASGWQQRVVSLDDGIGEAVVFDPTAVNKQRNLAAISPVEAGGAGETGDVDWRLEIGNRRYIFSL